MTKKRVRLDQPKFAEVLARAAHLCPNMGAVMDAKQSANGHDWRYCSTCGREYDALAGECPFCAAGEPAEFEQ